MKLAISNIAWTAEQDAAVYQWMRQYGYSGLEIAPTRIFSENPYQNQEHAAQWSRNMMQEYGFEIPSMQSIWFGREEKLFGSSRERQILTDYTKQSIDFAAAVGCHNLVFGCPRNRNIPEGADAAEGVSFFREVGEYAASCNTVVGMEANPPVYHTNYINDTASALKLVREVDSEGFLLNLDVGTMIQNQESLSELDGQVKYINHVHISEPGLAMIQERKMHEELAALLEKEGYQGYVSVEMGRRENLEEVERALAYVKGIFME